MLTVSPKIIKFAKFLGENIGKSDEQTIISAKHLQKHLKTPSRVSKSDPLCGQK
jgi:hypothetical protein